LHLKQRFGGTATFEQFCDTWNLVLDPEPIHGKELFERLAKNYRLGLLSNTDPIHVAYLESHYDFFSFFTARVYSCAVGASKPNPIIYREALRACRARAQEAVYVDDIEDNVKAAEQLGMMGVHFRSGEQLQSDFRELGLEI
jgi:HAD superfamily hydrolase (TIGR01509 family)